ncbi:uncharacterized protein BKA55DRAFT_555984 [Fusarium redolens]|uniref:Uncharacterized protein n=1 Tax=Fusarium redolens TaxID=48865 RepID=A0A9P9KSE2_FUSRE|nr:uncharacterized protein BKA55DRAFT_555984 [Fusarium redolens]KAH7267543.1 hypothetical protein BKA55DRAFT_555984 [Fusarium redolens]
MGVSIQIVTIADSSSMKESWCRSTFRRIDYGRNGSSGVANLVVELKNRLKHSR